MGYCLAAKKFWNSRSITKEFYSQSISNYWLDSFKSIKNRFNKKVLDLGCGGGRNTKMLINLEFDVYACDLYEGMINITKNRLKKMGLKNKFIENRIKKAPMTNLPYNSNFFDIVLSHGVYHNAQTMEEFNCALKESARVLKKRGLLYFNIFTSGFIAEDFRNIKGQQNLYITKENLPMILLSRSEFFKMASNYNLKPGTEITGYQSVVSTGKRSVLRGILVKSFNREK